MNAPLPKAWACGARVFASRDGYVRGYAAFFDQPDWSNNVILSGAFDDCLERRLASDLPILLNHSPHHCIGAWQRVRVRPRGLFVEGRLSREPRESRVGRDIASGELIGLSIGYRTLAAHQVGGLHKIGRLDLWEISIVPLPMQLGAYLEAWS